MGDHNPHKQGQPDIDYFRKRSDKIAENEHITQISRNKLVDWLKPSKFKLNLRIDK
jgi:hypothetical protein